MVGSTKNYQTMDLPASLKPYVSPKTKGIVLILAYDSLKLIFTAFWQIEIFLPKPQVLISKLRGGFIG